MLMMAEESKAICKTFGEMDDKYDRALEAKFTEAQKLAAMLPEQKKLFKKLIYPLRSYSQRKKR